MRGVIVVGDVWIDGVVVVGVVVRVSGWSLRIDGGMGFVLCVGLDGGVCVIYEVVDIGVCELDKGIVIN